MTGVDGQRVEERRYVPMSSGSILLPDGICKGCSVGGRGAVLAREIFMWQDGANDQFADAPKKRIC